MILPVQSFEGGASLTLSGPGIETTRGIAPLGLHRRFIETRVANRALFPRGHDLVLTTDDHCLVLPRTTRVEEA